MRAKMEAGQQDEHFKPHQGLVADPPTRSASADTLISPCFNAVGERVFFGWEKNSFPIRKSSMFRPIDLFWGLLFLSGFPLIDRFFPNVGFFVLGILMIPASFALRVYMRRMGDVRPSLLPTDEGDADLSKERLIARGHPRSLAVIAAVGDESFEPIVIRREVGKAGFFAIGTVALVFTFSLRRFIHLSRYMEMVFGVGSMIFATWLVAGVRPTYYRIVPGRLDVMKGRGFGPGTCVVQRINLTTARVVLKCDTRQIQIQPPGGESILIDYDHTSEPLRFVEAVFRGALCTSPAPPLPDESLLG